MSAFPTLNILIILTPLKLYQGGPAKGLSFHPKQPQLSCARLLVTSACFSRASWNITALCHLHLPKGAEHRPLIRLKPFKLIVIGTHYRTEFKEAARELTAKSTQKGLAEPNSEGSSRALHDLAVQPDIACKNVCQSGLKEA